MSSQSVPHSWTNPIEADLSGPASNDLPEDLRADTVGIISLPVEPANIDTTIVDHRIPVDLVGMLISEAGSQALEEGVVVTRQGAYFGMATGRGLLRELTERKEANLEVMLNNATQDLKAAQKQLLEKQRMEQELEIAAEIQAALLPRSLPEIPGYEFFSFYRSAKEVGGDYYDFIKLADGNHGLLVADISGKGVPGSLGMTMVRSVLRSQASVSSEPAETLRRTNAIIQPDMRSGMFVTVFYAVLNPILHRLRCASGGHNEAILVGAQGERLIAPTGIGLGLVTEEHYYAEEEDVILELGDTVVLYTDGVTEAMNPEWDEYGEGRFNEFLLKNKTAPLKDIVSGILADVAEFTHGAPQADDLTLVLLRRTA